MIKITKDPTGLWRVAGAPIISTGVEYPLMTGPTTFTQQNIEDAVKALQDPAIVSPRIKLGHTADYNMALVGDAEMAFGRVDGSTMALGDNNQTIYGDYLVPEWLGGVMGIAFPNRSMEGNFDVETATGRHYSMVITAVSLLGIHWPGCQVLDDLPLWYGAQIPDGVEFDDMISAQLAASQIAAEGGKVSKKKKIEADTDTSRIRRQFYDKAMSGELDTEGSTYWWWIRGERISDSGNLYLIVEDDESGDLYKCDVAVEGDEVNFGTPTAVEVQYVEKSADSLAAIAAGMAAVDEQLVVHASAADTGGPVKSTQEGSIQMDEATRKRLAASLGLADSATEATINAELQKRALAANPTSGAEGGEPDSAGKTGAEVQPEDEPSSHQTPPGTAPSGTGVTEGTEAPSTEEEEASDEEPTTEAGYVKIDMETYKLLRAGAEAGIRIEKKSKSDRQNDAVEAAIRAGKIPSARRAHYRQLMAADEQGTTKMLNDLPAGLVPVSEYGATGNTAVEGDLTAGQGEGLPSDWFPGLRERVAAASAPPKPVTHAREA